MVAIPAQFAELIFDCLFVSRYTGRAPSIIGPRLLGKPLEKLYREIAARTLNARVGESLSGRAGSARCLR